jgi:ribonucleoside-diphosphate reductase alpha chain
VPADYPFDAFKDLYATAWRHGLKGCTTFRPNPVTGAILSTAADTAEDIHCCSIEREGE